MILLRVLCQKNNNFGIEILIYLWLGLYRYRKQLQLPYMQ